MQDQQRYKCKECGYNFIDKPRRGHSAKDRALAVWLYLSGLSQRRIAPLFGVSPVAVLKWIRGFALAHTDQPTPPSGGIVVVEVDEMWHFLKKVGQNLDREGLLSR
jgi:transposase-like protein